jgi:hypothetical protein
LLSFVAGGGSQIEPLAVAATQMQSDRRFGLALIFSQLQPAKQTVKNSCREVCRSGVRFSVKNPMATEKNGGGKLLQAPAETNRKSSQGVNPDKMAMSREISFTNTSNNSGYDFSIDGEDSIWCFIFSNWMEVIWRG